MTAAAGHPDDGPQFCYRHPDRETLIRCGRCDQPICLDCAMQGPVGFRCRECGKPAFDPLTLTPRQALAGLAVSFGIGLFASLIASRIGFFALFISFIAGGFVAQSVVSVTGYKHGWQMLAVAYGGIALGAAAAFWFQNGDLISMLLSSGAATGGGDGRPGVGDVLANALLWAVIDAGAICAGAWARLR